MELLGHREPKVATGRLTTSAVPGGLFVRPIDLTGLTPLFDWSNDGEDEAVQDNTINIAIEENMDMVGSS